MFVCIKLEFNAGLKGFKQQSFAMIYQKTATGDLKK